MSRALLISILSLALAGCSGSSGGGGSSGGTGQASGTTSSTGSGSGSGTSSSFGQLLAGAAAFDVTPSNGAPLGGFGGQPRRVIDWVTVPLHLLAVGGACFDPHPSDAATFFQPAQGAHDPIMVRVLMLENAQQKACIVKLDTIGVSPRLRRDVEQLAQGFGVSRENLLVCATHTHSGPGAVSEQTIWQLIAMDCLNDSTYNSMLLGVEQAMRQADQARRPAELGIDVGQDTRISRNRRGRPTVVDHDLAIIKITEPGGAPIAAVMNYAVHGTCLGQTNMLFSADLMGYAERGLETKLGGGVALFVNAAEGDVRPTMGGFQGAMDLGDMLSDTAAQIWSGIQTKAQVEIKGAFEERPMPPATINVGCPEIPGTNTNLCSFLPGITINIPLIIVSVPQDLPFQALKLDDVVIGTVPGEPITEIGLDIKNAGLAKGFRHTLVAGLANGYAGYVTTQSEYIRGEYEGTATLYGPTTGQVVVDHVATLMDRVR